MSINNSFLGKGWCFPPEFNKSNAEVEMTEDELDIKKSLEILLSTHPGERIMHPNFGCDLTQLLFQPLNLSLITHISDIIETAIILHEPRIDVSNISIEQSEENQALMLITIDYSIRITNTRHNMVYPFYKKEGTELD